MSIDDQAQAERTIHGIDGVFPGNFGHPGHKDRIFRIDTFSHSSALFSGTKKADKKKTLLSASHMSVPEGYPATHILDDLGES